MPELAGVLFDLDGTLVDSEKYHLKAWNQVLTGLGLVLEPGWNADAIGIPDIDTAVLFASRHPGLPPAEEIHDAKQALYRQLVREAGRDIVYPGVEDGLRRLTAAGYRMAVGTNSGNENTLSALEAAGIAGFFPVRVTYDMVQSGKPAPDIYAEAARRLGLVPEQCAVAEDSLAGVTSGLAAGCLTLGITTTCEADVLRDAAMIFPDTPAAIAWLAEQREESGKR